MTEHIKLPAEWIERIRELRNEGWGLLDARKIAAREHLLKLLDKAETVDDLKPIIHAMLKLDNAGA